MTTADLLDSLVSQCQERDTAGRVPSPDAVCRDYPDLLPEVLRRLKAVEWFDSFESRDRSTHSHMPETLPLRPAAAGGGPGRQVGRYTLVERLGEGGMGEVWVAQQADPVRRRVALKLIKGGADFAEVVTRFEQERQALALMDHSNIARVFDGGTTDAGQPFFVMELVAGLPLTDFCAARRLSAAARLGLFAAVCSAVQHAHQKGVVHRDLKPSNILVTVVDGDPVPKVIDFGVAKAVSGKLTDRTLATGLGAVIGTLEYMAPEQAGTTLEDVDTRADVYSLGVVLYELLTGLRPFDAHRLRGVAYHEAVRIVCEEDPPRPSTRLAARAGSDGGRPAPAGDVRKLTAALRGELDWVVMKCLEKDRSRRYESASALARDVQRYLADEPVEARPPSFAYRAGKLARKNRGVVLAAALIAATLVVGLAASTAGLVRARTAERTAAQDRDRADEANRVARRKSDEASRLAEDWFIAVSENPELKDLPEASTLRAQLLQRAERHLAQLDAEGDDSPEAARKRFLAVRSMAVIAADTRQPNDSALFRRALALLEAATWPMGPVEKDFEAAKLLKLLAVSSEFEKKPADRLDLLRRAEGRLVAATRAEPTSVALDAYHADLVRMIGSQQMRGLAPGQAEAEISRAIDLVAQARRRHGDGPELDHTRLACLKAFCELAWASEQPAVAFRHLDEMVQLADRLGAGKDVSNSVLDTCAGAWTDAAIVRDLTGRPDLAADLFVKAREARQQLFFRSPANKRHAQNLAIQCHNASVFFRKQRDFARAEQEAAEGIRTFRFLASAYGHLQQSHYDLYGAIRNRAQVLLESGDAGKALLAVAEAETAYRQFLAQFPAPVPIAQARAALIFDVKGQALAAQGKLTQALAAFDEAPRTQRPADAAKIYRDVWDRWLKSSPVAEVKSLAPAAAVARAEGLLGSANAYDRILALVCFQHAIDRQRAEPAAAGKGVPSADFLRERCASILEGLRDMPGFPAAERLPAVLAAPELKPLADLPRTKKVLADLAAPK